MRLMVKGVAKLLLLLVIGISQPVLASSESNPITFAADGNKLSGLLDVPANGEAHALVIIVHGYGKTNVVEQNWYFDLRVHFAKEGIATFVWDKPGCGTSEGEFDPNQPVKSSAGEVLAAAQFLRDQNIPGSQKIGLWGISRAGWIAPLAMSQDDEIKFWISVSGVDAKESFGYLLQSNWKLEGYDNAEIEHLYGQWLNGNRIVANAGAFDDYLAATVDLRSDPFFDYMSGGDTSIGKAGFSALVENWRELGQTIDSDSGLALYVEGFPEMLGQLDVSVLALFGERDSIVDWRSTRQLYEETIGQNPNATLRIATFPDGNHNLHQSENGSFKEMLEILSSPKIVAGYYDAISAWISEVVAAEEEPES
ncbi:MAG: alpha/beta fold hydrolase [Erythrobacter sp.]|uniref:alpha/beta hydrolase family protein n=1 Tax=Erythrobacter sp. TaxID=1042 RepID=UPI00329A5618